ncbi:MAG: tRNA (adenosine(37)-N6)-dimethylallyltransferase MiaA [Bdellovibrionales bacterium]|nr:tRNA (adenosine(37)-N6)-dimethylallyltransferase MiaA [Bdellovibrionales bacterium]
MSQFSKPTVLFVVGPTASGKSDLALKIAQMFQAPIINGDSLQVYRSLNIGTAKPTSRERSLVPHFLFGHIDDGESYTAGDYRREVLELLRRETNTPLWIIVGGSGFYLQALEKGMFDVPTVPTSISDKWKSRLQEKGHAFLYQALKNQDPDWAEKINEEDSYRLVRALSVMEMTQKSMSDLEREFQQKKMGLSEDYQILKLGVSMDRERLRQRVTIRLHKMLENGFQEEVEALLKKGLSLWPPLESVGYKEMVQFLRKEISESERDELIIRNTMRLAKRQRTWFQRDSEIFWLDGNANPFDLSVPWLNKVYCSN